MGVARWTVHDYGEGMTDIERAIFDKLKELEKAVADLQAGAQPKPSLVPIFEELDRLGAEIPRGESGDLRHYIQRKSYEKARLYLEGRDAENARGVCRD